MRTTGSPKRACAAGWTTSFIQVSSAAIIGQSSVAVEFKVTVPSARAVTLNGCVRPQMPGPLISCEGLSEALS